ncbi:MAG: NAD(P)-binding protein, partial [Betaproteobacteria bacterium]|nr:NAD(P)-binding protein [Betaproteobacteria bacterium]
YLFSQFLCPEENRRQDEYGGSLGNRARISLDTLRRIKADLPNYPVIFRLSVDDFFPTGLKFEEGFVVAKWAAAAGADAIHVSAGHYRALPTAHRMIPPMEYPEGVFLDYAARIKAEVAVPVIAVGRLGNPAIAMAAVDTGKTDFVALGRALIADPEWVNKVERNVPVRRCLSCNKCIDEMRGGDPLTCLVNPTAGRELEFAAGTIARKGERICVIGAGPAGLSYASLVARGNHVTVFERERASGGAFRYAGRAPQFQGVEAKQESLDAYVGELERACTQDGVTFEYGVDGAKSPQALRGYDRIVIATGAQYRFGCGPIIYWLLEHQWGKSQLMRKLFSSERLRNWFYYRARRATGKRYGALARPSGALARPSQKISVIGDAVRAGKGKEAIDSAFRTAYFAE